MTDEIALWEILVPTTMSSHDDVARPVKTRYHRVWDQQVRDITGGLTIMTPAKGQWVSPDDEVFAERMIPVRIMCTESQMCAIAQMTLEYYRQKAVMYYKLATDIRIHSATADAVQTSTS